MRICVYCGSSPGTSPRFLAAARLLGRRLSEQGHSLVYGGSHVGLMGALADATLAAGGPVTGVIPQSLVDREFAHRGLTELHVVDSMHARKALMAQLADGFVALPGGVGTLEELFETWTAMLLGLHAKPLGLLDVDGFFAPFLRMIDATVAAGFLARAAADTLHLDTDPDTLLAALSSAIADPGAAPEAVSSPRPAAVPEPLDALAWVVVRDGRLLQVRSRDNEVFYLPGGKREPGESDAAALCREVREELGVELDATTLTLVTQVTAPAHGAEPGRAVRLTCYAAAPADGSPEPVPAGEITELRWLTTDERRLAAPAGQLLMDQLAGRGLMR